MRKSKKSKKHKDALSILRDRLQKIGIRIEVIGNYPWIYLFSVNGRVVRERYRGNHGWTIAFMSIRRGTELKLVETVEIFKIIRKYIEKE